MDKYKSISTKDITIELHFIHLINRKTNDRMLFVYQSIKLIGEFITKHAVLKDSKRRSH